MANIENVQIHADKKDDDFIRIEERTVNGETYKVGIREDSNGDEYAVALLDTTERFSKLNH